MHGKFEKFTCLSFRAERETPSDHQGPRMLTELCLLHVLLLFVVLCLCVLSAGYASFVCVAVFLCAVGLG
jgi:hypothetical protein